MCEKSYKSNQALQNHRKDKHPNKLAISLSNQTQPKSVKKRDFKDEHKLTKLNVRAIESDNDDIFECAMQQQLSKQPAA
jgi:hypothetical protein